ncbi:MAG: 4Fe-4S binding protein [Candidatus Caenarcaniphilales bacterium]|nr:4Fe-4S binding protein [Candidatus Caenarcaniphilales bacterium]
MNGFTLEGRSQAEKIFILLFVPAIIAFYSIYKYPEWFGARLEQFYLWGKSLGFWYALVYTLIVCGISAWVVLREANPYWRAKVKKPLEPYQKFKFISIFVVQFLVFFLAPQVIAPLIAGKPFYPDPPGIEAHKTAHVYMYPAFSSIGIAVYLFLVIPALVFFFGKRYCSWFCSCGNLAETVGVTEWGTKWVKEYTPRGETAKSLEIIQVIVLVFSLVFGVIILADGYQVFQGLFRGTHEALKAFQDLTIDFLFGSVLGVGLYPFLGTRVWCRYGCPLARFMMLFGSFTKSKFAVIANDKCRGLNLCTSVCPMGIDVASYAHKDKKPIQGGFGLDKEPCIGCGGCISICPVEALSFKKISS